MKRLFSKLKQDGYTLLEVVATTSGVLALTAGAGFMIHNTVQESQYEKMLESAASVGYTEALDLMTGFQYDAPEDVADAITAELASLSTEDYTLDYKGSDANSLCVFATPKDWVIGEDDLEHYAASGACGEPEEVVETIVENTTDDRTTLVYRCDEDTLVNIPILFSSSNIYQAEMEVSRGNSLSLTAWIEDNPLLMKSGEEYRIHLYGEYSSFRNNSSGSECLREVQHIGEDVNPRTLSYFGENIELVPKNIPESVKDLSSAFRGSSVFNHENIQDWDTSNVTMMSYMFRDAEHFDQDISAWDTSNVRDASYMFYRASNFNNGQAALDWNMGSLTSARYMFYYATSFDQDISAWDVSQLRNMQYMFAFAHNFNNGDHPFDWNKKTSNVQNMQNTFSSTKRFNQPIGDWDTSSVTNMQSTFSSTELFNQDLSQWDTSNVTTISRMFQNANAFNANIQTWDTSNVTNMSYAFYRTREFNQDISNWKTHNVTDMSWMFEGAHSFNQPIGKWDTSSLKRITGMFSSAHEFNQDLSNWKTDNLTEIIGVFKNAYAFNNGEEPGESNRPLKWNTSQVTNMSQVFYFANSFNQDISSWKTEKVTAMDGMFRNTVFNQDITGWDTGNVTNMSQMFYGAKEFNQPINTWDVSNVWNMEWLFYETEAFNQPLHDWDTSSVMNMRSVFGEALKFDQDVSMWNVENVTRHQNFTTLRSALKDQNKLPNFP